MSWIDDFNRKVREINHTKYSLRERINSLGGSIDYNTKFRDYLVWLDSLYEKLNDMTITGLPDSLEGKCEQEGTPTPTSPQPINITTGRQVVSVSDGNTTNDYEINLGKNLVNALDTSSMINFTKSDDVFTTSALTSSGYGGIASMTFTNSTPIMKNGVGYFSADIRLVSGTTSSINVIGDKALTRTNAGWVSNHTLSNEFQRYCYKYDVSMGTSFTGFMIQLYNCNNAVLEVKNIMFSYSSDLDYSPYKTPIYLGKIGTYQDYIFRNTTENPLYDSNLEEGQWYIHKEIGRVVLNGSETWNVLGTNPNRYYTGSYSSQLSGLSVSQALSNYFVFDGIIPNTTTDKRFFFNKSTGQTTSNGNLSIVYNDITSANDLKTWLSAHNVEIYYVLNTPITIPIEDEELINQLNEIDIFTVISEDFYN